MVRCSRRGFLCRAASGIAGTAGPTAVALLATPAARGAGAADGSGQGPPPMQLAVEADPAMDPVGWLVSEKLDGIRAWWDGRGLRTRGGTRIQPPPGFTDGWPAQPLDGELWSGRGRFETLAATVRDGVPDAAAWRAVRFHAFDLPAVPGGFAARAAALQRLVTGLARPTLVAVEQRRVPDREALQRWLDAVLAAGGEGLMLHRADAPAAPGRTGALRKLKRAHDAEAVVIAHLPGRGRHAGRLGALRVRTADGREFSVGTGLSDAERTAPPPPGTTITYRHHGLTARGLPRFPSFVRVHAPL